MPLSLSMLCTNASFPLIFGSLKPSQTKTLLDLRPFFDRYRKLYRTLITIIERGIEEGVFHERPADEQTVVILSTNEGLQHHYHAKRRKELILEASGYSVRDYTPEDIASMTGESILPSLMKSPSELEDAIIEGRRLYYMLENELGKQ